MAIARDPRTVRDDPFDRPPDPYDVANFFKEAEPHADRLLKEIADQHDIKLSLSSWESLRQRLRLHIALALRAREMGLHKLRD
jgi:hypothetical protein